MSSSAPWSTRIEDYIAYRRSHGYELAMEAGRLRQFAQFAEQTWHQDRLTIELASAWARTSKRQTPITWARRIEVLRGFAKYWIRFDATTEIPPRNLFGPAHRRLIPHIYTKEEIFSLMDATDLLSPVDGLRPATCRTVFGLLAASGLRISEAVNLTRTDVNLDTGILSIRQAKFHKSRLVPLHPSVTAALQGYAKRRDQCVPSPENDCFFLSDLGKPINRRMMLYALHDLCNRLGWQPRGDYKHHRLHDLRHTFIVHSTLQFYQQKIELDRAVLALSNYVGHSEIAHTYWYFTGIPELMAIAAERFNHYAQGEPL